MVAEDIVGKLWEKDVTRKDLGETSNLNHSQKNVRSHNIAQYSRKMAVSYCGSGRQLAQASCLITF